MSEPVRIGTYMLHDVFFATPYRPTGLSTSARAVVRLVDELRWLNTIVLRSALTVPHTMHGIPEVCAVKRAAADVLTCAADVMESPERGGAPTLVPASY